MERTVLVVDDEAQIRKSLKGVLSDEGYRVVMAEDGPNALSVVEEESPDIVLLDIWMPDMDGIQVLKKIKEDHPSLPVVMISGHGNIETAVTATKLGAFDFIEKPLSLEKILVIINNALNLKDLAEENLILRLKAKKRVRLTGNSKPMAELLAQIERVAPTDAWVLVMGENGTGKELVSRAIHSLSNRAEKPLIEVNCAAIPEELIESELFGHEKGAFTGANQRRRGKFDLANHGTLFLDEIGDMSLKTQAKILRILQEQKFDRVGGAKTIFVDVRVIAASNKNLEEEIEKGTFREDLYYRLKVVPIHVPPLRERLEDIPPLVEDFLAEFGDKEWLGKKYVTDAAIERLKQHHWPGNVRELKNFVERLVIMTPGEKIDVQNIPEIDGQPQRQVPEMLFVEKGLKEARTAFEREFIQRKLMENGWNISQTAEAIGVERSHLHRKIKSLGLDAEGAKRGK